MKEKCKKEKNKTELCSNCETNITPETREKNPKISLMVASLIIPFLGAILFIVKVRKSFRVADLYLRAGTINCLLVAICTIIFN